MNELLERSEALIERTPIDFKRYLFDRINWEDRLVGIKGARGTGKTTMLLQWLKENEYHAPEAAYWTLDDLYFTNHSLVETARTFHQQGGTVLVLDEVHKYPQWAREIKNLYDLYPDLKLIFTGSSIIDISRQEGDLSRRVLMYELHGLSFREYLSLFQEIDLPAYSMEKLLKNPGRIRKDLPKGFKPLAHFKGYLEHGYYPFFSDEVIEFQQRLQQLVRTIVEYDMAELKGFDIRNARKMLQLLGVIADQVPFRPNISQLAQKTHIHRNSITNYLHFLEQAHLIGLLQPAGNSVATLQKPEKILLNNPTLHYALSPSPSIGTVREAFFFSQAKVDHQISAPQKGDFRIDDRLLFEIGGKNKEKGQISGIPNAHVVRDDLEFPVGRTLPLWYFGLVY